MTIHYHITQLSKQYGIKDYRISEASVLLDPTTWEGRINIGTNAGLILSSSIIFSPDFISISPEIYNPLQLIIDSGNNNVRMIEDFKFNNVSYHFETDELNHNTGFCFPVNACSNIIIPITGIVNIKLIKPISSTIIRTSIHYLTLTP